MGLSLRARARHRAFVWYWRARYWWMDCESGTWARVGVQALLVVVALDQMIRGTVTALAPPDPTEPVKAYVWVVQLIIAIVAAIAVYALTPKPETPQAKQQETPNVEDGAHVLEIHGDVWIEGEGEFVLQHMVVGKEAIKSKGKK